MNSQDTQNFNLAKNVLERAVTILPRMDELWRKYALLCEQLGDAAGARAVFERWMRWAPDPEAWKAFIRMELR